MTISRAIAILITRRSSRSSAAIDDLASEQAGNLALDGCGAPAYANSLYSLARAYGRLVQAAATGRGVGCEAIRTHPEFVSGTPPRRA